MSSIIDSEYIAPTRPYSQMELQSNRDKLYKSLRLGTTRAYHTKCNHFYYVRHHSKKENEILTSNSCDSGNCSVCWKLHKINRISKQRAINMVEQYSNSFYEEPKYLTYNGIDLETIYYKWLYQDQSESDGVLV